MSPTKAVVGGFISAALLVPSGGAGVRAFSSEPPLTTTVAQGSIARSFSTLGQARVLPNRAEAVYFGGNYLAADDQAKVKAVNFRRAVIVIAYGDFRGCASGLSITSMTRMGRKLIVRASVETGSRCAIDDFTYHLFHAIRVPKRIIGIPVPRIVRLVVTRTLQ